MVKIQISYTLDDEAVALSIATTAYARYPQRFRMKTPESKDGVFHIYLNPRGKFRK